jgi:hypothetical protein
MWRLPGSLFGGDAAPRRRTNRKVAAVAAVAVVVAALTTAVIVAQTAKRPSETAVAEVPLDLSALDERVRLGRVGTGAMDSTKVLHPGEGSLVATLGTRRVFLIEASGNRLCVLVVAENSGGASSHCQPRDDLLTAGIVHTSRPPGTVPETVIVVAPDGYTAAAFGEKTVAITSNVAVLEAMTLPDSVTITGPRVPDVTFLLGAASDRADPSAATDREVNARLALADLIRSAGLYTREHGTTDGFARSMRAAGPALTRQLTSLTDTSAVAEVGPQRCLRADLQTGTITEISC